MSRGCSNHRVNVSDLTHPKNMQEKRGHIWTRIKIQVNRLQSSCHVELARNRSAVIYPASE
jgi:hypothetical protein